MLIYPKEDIRNPFDQILFKKGKAYECEKVDWDDNEYVVTCELIANEYPIVSIDFIREKFYTIEDIRDSNIATIINF
jgi:hypothetical protein